MLRTRRASRGKFMNISKIIKKVAAVVSVGALGLMSGETAEAALPIQGTGGDLNISVTVDGVCTMTAPTAITLTTWTYGNPSANTGTSTFDVDCGGAAVPWEISNDGGNAGTGGPVFRAFGLGFEAPETGFGSGDSMGYNLTASQETGTGGAAATTVTLTFTPDGTFGLGGAEPSNGVYTDTVHVNLHY